MNEYYIVHPDYRGQNRKMQSEGDVKIPNILSNIVARVTY